MTHTPITPSPSAASSEVSGLEVSGPDVEVMLRDAVLGGRAMSSGQFLAGLVANGQLETVGRPDKLARDMFPGVDPETVQAVWDRALAVGFHAGRTSAAPRLFRDQMERIGDAFTKAGFHAMGGMVARSRRLVAPESAHPADSDTGREH